MPHPKVQAQRSAMVGRNQLGSRIGAQTLAAREGAGEGLEIWKKDEKTWENSERCRSLYLDKAAGGAMHGALPEGAAPNPTGPRLGWKQERAALLPSPRL